MQLQGLDTLFGGAMLVTALTYVGYQLKSLPTMVYHQIRKRLIYSVHITPETSLFFMLEDWLATFHKEKYRNVAAKSIGDELMFQHFSDLFYINYDNKKIIINKEREKLDNAAVNPNWAHRDTFIISGFNSKKVINKFLQEILNYNKSKPKESQDLYLNSAMRSEWSLSRRLKGKCLNEIILANKDEIISDIDQFVANEDWYIKRNIAYKRGIMLYGEPGNGKTSLCIAIAEHLNRDIFFLNLNEVISDRNLYELYNSIPNNSILVIEDMDVSIHKKTRDPKEAKLKKNPDSEDKPKGVSIAGLLNCMDGLMYREGLITIITTNNPQDIYEPLLRPGRIDMKIDISNPGKTEVEKYLSKFYDTEVVLKSYSKNLSMAAIQGICLEHKYDLNKTVSILIQK